MQKKYKVEIIETQKYIIDVLASSEEKAIEEAKKAFESLEVSGIQHYHADDDPEVTAGDIYDVTNTDDPFNPLND